MQNINYTYSGFASNGTKVWYITLADNLLMEVNSLNGEVICLGKIPSTGCVYGAYRTLVYKMGKLYIIPFNSSKLCIFDFTSKKFKFLDIFQKFFQTGIESLKLFGLISYKDEIIIYGLYPMIFRFNVLTYNIVGYEIDNKEMANNNYYFWKDGFVINKIYF